MSISSLKKLAAAFNVPHGEHTTKGLECLHCVCEAAQREIEALERTAVGLYEHGLIDEGVTEGAEEATATMRRIAEEAE